MNEPIVRPDLLKNEYLQYLDELRESGETNMYGAAPYLAEEFDLDKNFARQVVAFWMKSFSERHGGLTPREPDSLKAGDSCLPAVVKYESNLPA